MTETVDESTSRFAAATAVTSVGEGTYRATLDEAFTIMGKPNGGYLLAIAARAATAHLGALGVEHPHCLAAAASYVRASAVGEAEVVVEVRRVGRTVTHVAARILQDGEVAVESLLSCGRLPDGHEAHHDAIVAPTMPDPEGCERTTLVGSPPQPGRSILDSVDLRLDPATTGYVRGELADDAEVRGWLRMADGSAFDPLSLLLAADTLPPATFPIGSSGWVPTIQLSVYVRRVPVAGWLLARQRAQLISGGLVDETCELWDETGRVVAQAVQLAMVRFSD